MATIEIAGNGVGVKKVSLSAVITRESDGSQEQACLQCGKTTPYVEGAESTDCPHCKKPYEVSSQYITVCANTECGAPLHCQQLRCMVCGTPREATAPITS